MIIDIQDGKYYPKKKDPAMFRGNYNLFGTWILKNGIESTILFKMRLLHQRFQRIIPKLEDCAK